VIAPRSEAAAAELLGVVDLGGLVVQGGAREGAREGQGHETQVLLRRPGLLGTATSPRSIGFCAIWDCISSS